jgi:predicted permease
MLLLIGAGLTLRSFGRLATQDPGFDPGHVVVSGLSLPAARYPDDPHIIAFYQELKERLGALPGASAVLVGFPLPYSQAGITLRFNEAGAPPPDPGHEQVAAFHGVSEGYARTLAIPVRRGRFLTEADDRPASPRVVVVNEAFARAFFPGQDVLGKELVIGYEKDARPNRVIGVLGDTRGFALDHEPQPEMLVPFSRAPSPGLQIAVRTASPAGFADGLRRLVEGLDADQPIEGIRPMTELVGESIDRQRLSTLLLGVFGAVALALALVGVYGVMSYTVTQRVREIGLRMALGARPGDVTRMVVRQGLGLALAGVAVGTVLALGLGHAVSGLLYGVSGTDPITYLAMAALLTGVTGLATWIPARRAARVDPMIALRSD